MPECPGCGAYVAKERGLLIGKADYCSTCRIEASNEGRDLNPSDGELTIALGLLAVGVVIVVLKWIFEFIWDYKWWILGLLIIAILYFNNDSTINKSNNMIKIEMD